MLSVAPPPPAARYRPLTGPLGGICRDTHRQLYAIGLGMFMVAGALVLGVSGTDSENSNDEIRMTNQ
jgi:hypothetical protein